MRFFIFLSALFFSIATAAQQPVRLQASFPQYLRQGDRTELRVTVINHTAFEGTGQAELQLTNWQTGESVDGWFQNVFPAQYVTVGAGGSEVLRFPVEVPFLFYNTLAWKVLVRMPYGKDSAHAFYAEALGQMPILTSKAFKTETALLSPDSTTTTLPALLAADSSEDINHYSITIAAATDPALLLCHQLKDQANGAGQTSFDAGNRMFASALLFSKRFEAAWPKPDSSGNWRSEPPNDALFYMQRAQAPGLRGMTWNNPETEFFAIAERQLPSGGFSWVPGGAEDIKATLQIVRQLAWMRQMEAKPTDAAQKMADLFPKAVRWLNRQIETAENNTTIQEVLTEVLYVRSLLPLNDAYITGKTQQLLQGMHSEALAPEAKGYLLLALRNNNMPEHERLFAQLLKDTAFLQHKNAPAMLLLYATAQGLDHLKTNIARQLLRSNGETTWAAYALLRAFPATAKTLPATSLRVGNQRVAITGGASFFTKTIKPPFIKASMGAVQLPQLETQPWVMINWHYFQDKAIDSHTSIIKKQFFKKTNNGVQVMEAGAPLHIGDTISVELSIAPKPSPEKWVLQDTWPAAMEALSASQQPDKKRHGQIEFFIERPQVPVIFRYDLMVRYAGTFSSGGTRVMAVPSQKGISALPSETVYTE